MCLNDEFAQFMLLIVIFANKSLLTANIIK